MNRDESREPFRTTLTRAESRRVDEIAIGRLGVPGIVLMENAGRGAAAEINRISQEWKDSRDDVSTDAEPKIVILCGKGNNGGDGYVIARHLLLCGFKPWIIALSPPDELSVDAAIAAKIAKIAAAIDLPIQKVSAAADDLRHTLIKSIGRADIIVDCMLGTGATGDPRQPYANAIKACNHKEAIRIAIDIPTGLDCDSGVPNTPTFRAHHTLTFVTKKVGFQTAAASDFLGKVSVIDIGVPPSHLVPSDNP